MRRILDRLLGRWRFRLVDYSLPGSALLCDGYLTWRKIIRIEKVWEVTL